MRIVTAMSGGVDSSVAAALLVEQGHDVIGVHMKVHDLPTANPASDKRCCGLDDARDARLVADRLGIPFYVMDLREAFQKSVIDDFAAEYAQGRTPNPCVHCNGTLKFRVLLARAQALGADLLATGHYARSVDGQLLTAVDSAKDQSYFLWQLRPEALRKTVFPLGELDKTAVRAHARRLGLLTADKPESQEICFIPDGDHASFVHRERPELEADGEIVDEDGHVLGRHEGYWRFTVGQRRGIGVALGKPIYVLRIDPESRRVVVGYDDRLRHDGLVANGCAWMAEPQGRVHVRIRHRGGLIPSRVEVDGPTATIRFETPARAVTPGQSAVVYDGDRVIGGGYVLRALTDTAAAETFAV